MRRSLGNDLFMLTQDYTMKLPFPDISGRLIPQQARMWKTLVFLVRVSALSLPLYMIIWLGLDLYPLQVVAASQAAMLLHLMGYHLVHQGTGIILENGFRFYIIADCTGWKSMLFLFAMVFAVPGIALKKRLLGLAVGIPLIWLANLGRITGVVASQGIWGTQAAMLLHNTVFQLGMIAAVLIIWIAWLLWAKKGLPGFSG